MKGTAIRLPAGDMHVGMRHVGGSGPQRCIHNLPEEGAETGVCRLRMEPPTGSKGRAPGSGGCSGGQPPPEAESFLSIFVQKLWPKVQDLNENLALCLRQTASRSHDQPSSHKFWLMGEGGGGRPVRPYLDPPLAVHYPKG